MEERKSVTIDDINAVESEAGIIATLIHHPDFSFYSEHLLPNHFTKRENAYIYTAITKLANNNIQTIDPYNIIEVLNSEEATRRYTEILSVDLLDEMVDMSSVLARSSVEEYKILVSNVIDAAFRRDAYSKLQICQSMCFDRSVENVEQKIYETIDDIMLEYSSSSEIPQFREVADSLWEEIKARQGVGYTGIPFKFPSLNDFVTIERGELVVFSAKQKAGKSIMLLNCAVDLLKRGMSVLYIDSELSTRLHTARLLSHLTGIEYRRLTAGLYTPEEEQRIIEAKDWMKQQKYTHIYMPFFDTQSIYTTVKKVKHTQGIDVLIVDYFKATGDESDAYATYANLGRCVDLVKNEIAGNMNIAAIGACQSTENDKIADSAKIARNASTIIMLKAKTKEEIEEDGAECGNSKIVVAINRNGMQHAQNEYIDLAFDGNRILFEEAKQHVPKMPY